MTSKQIMAAIAPCGLNCVKCFAHVDGPIRKHSRKLLEALGNFDAYAERYVTLLNEPVFKNYQSFKQMLEFFAAKKCQGCRNEQCKLFAECGVRKCHQQKGVDYCHECAEFPCGNTNFDERLYGVWLAVNQKILDVRLDAFHEKSMARPRYV
jgi:hypothetical protein